MGPENESVRKRLNEILKGIREKTFQITDENREEIRTLILDAAWARFIANHIVLEYNHACLKSGAFSKSAPLLPSIQREQDMKPVERPLWQRAFEDRRGK